ncbi:MAG TPA: metallopeptidase TldD-related protein [Rectinemataceae bacterium]|nr:metallopeptidase TldD-related protein [Rectinemataceae bacterium]
MNRKDELETRFGRAVDVLLGELRGDEELSLEFSGEDSVFLRFNEARVRQIGAVDKAELLLTYCRKGRTMRSSFAVSGEAGADAELAASALGRVRREASLLPEDPYQTLPATEGVSREVFAGSLPDAARLPEIVLGPAESLAAEGAAYVGIHTQGRVARGAANSRGACHWFETESFITDYSAYLANGKATKSLYAGRIWDGEEYGRRLAAERPRLAALALPPKILPPGEYRAWLAPEAFARIVPYFSWHGIGEREIREGESAWLALREGRKTLSPRFRLDQDFSLGLEPRFNELGEVAPESLALIGEGRLLDTLVSARSARQYGLSGNGAPEDEWLRSASVGAGELDERAALEAIGSGLYLSNLHYLNWSDFQSARVTGMTRYACFWVEGGKIAAPIGDMRFDESLYRLFGDKLVGLSRQRSPVVETSSYGRRALGGSLLPGILVEGLTFTL